jgi:hypothetical protein
MLDFSLYKPANEDEFKHQRHHTSQILESVTPIENYSRKLRIDLTNASPYWQVKCFFKNKTYTKSLSTTNRLVAKNAAKEFHSFRNQANITDYLFFPELKDRKFVLIYFGWQFKFVQEQACIEANASSGRTGLCTRCVTHQSHSACCMAGLLTC